MAMRTFLGGAAIVVATVIITFANAVRGDFVMDGAALVLGNPAIREMTWANIMAIGSRDYWQPLGTNGLFRPVTTLSFMANWAVLGHGAWAPGYRATNVALHAVVACALLGWLHQLGVGARAAIAAAVVFAVHPIATDVVPNVAGRADLLAAVGVVGALLAHGQALGCGRWATAWYMLALGLSIVAGFSKEHALVAAPLLCAQSWVRAQRVTGRTAVVATIPVAAMAVARAWLWRTGYPAEIAPVDNPLVELSWWRAFASAIEVIGFGAGTIVWPARLAADYSFDQVPMFDGRPIGVRMLGGLAAGLVILGGLPWCAYHARRRPARCLPVLLAVGALVPSSNLLLTIGSIRGDRFWYLPLVGLCGVAVPAILERAGRMSLLGVAAVALALGVRTIERNPVWTSDTALWDAMVVDAPRSAKAHKGRAASLWLSAGTQQLDDVERHAREAVRIRGDYLPALIDLGTYLQARGDRDGMRRAHVEAARVLKRARHYESKAVERFAAGMEARGHLAETIPPYGNTKLHAALGAVAGRLGRPSIAVRSYRQLLRLDPWAVGTYLDLAAASVGRRDATTAVIALHAAGILAPHDEEPRARLAELYRHLTPPIDPARDRCGGYAGLARVFDDARLPDVSARYAAEAAACQRSLPG